MPPTSYSRHAWSRVLERLALTPAEVAALLDHELAVTVGVRGRRAHRLFYSPPDQQCFVAIQDQHVGLVVTVLPLDYHRESAWAVSRDAQDQAERLLQRRPGSALDEVTRHDGTAPNLIRVGCYFTTGQGGLRFQKLGSLPAARFDHQVARLLEDDEALDEVERRIHEKARLGEVAVETFVRLGRTGSVTRINLGRPLAGPERRKAPRGRPAVSASPGLRTETVG